MSMRRLYTRIYLHFLGVLVVVGLASVMVSWITRAPFPQRSAARLARHLAGLVRDQCGEPASCARVVNRLSEELDIDLTLRGPDGRVIAMAGRELPVLTAADVKPSGAEPIGLKRGRGFIGAVPIVKDGAVVGVLEAAHRFGMPWRPIATLALVLVVVGLAVAPLARRISRPVEELIEASRRLGGGDLSYRVQARSWHAPHRADELAALTQAWNEMAERVERLVRGQKELLANVSHELRSPLARIRVALELVPRDGETESRLRDIELDLAELERLIDDVLTASKLETAGLPTHIEPVEVEALLEQLRERAAHDPTTSGKDVRVQAHAGAPDEVSADGGLLKRALWNLVENAAKYGAPPITLEAERRDGVLALSVADEGPGIAPADRERVLAPFFRADKARTPGPPGAPGAPGAPTRGFGLGLTIARRVAEVHGGSIAIESAHGERGCKVTLRIPIPS